MVRSDSIYPGSFLLVRATPSSSVHGVLVRFLIGVAIETPSTLEHAHDVVVVWSVPGIASAETFRSGPKEKLLDIFGPWTSTHALTLAEYQVCSLPSPVVHLSDILECNFDLSSDATLPYDVFDALRSHHGIDVTGLSVSSAHRGNLCRSYALLGAGCDDMAAFKAQSAEATLGATNSWDTAMRLCLLHELLKNSLAPDLRHCRRACGIPATKKKGT
jgi:hypothetical protein